MSAIRRVITAFSPSHVRALDPWADFGLLIVRLGCCGLLVWRHGLPKLPALMTGLVEGPIRFFDPLGLGPAASLALATFAELFCAGLVLVGLLGRLACIPLVANFAVIVLVVHEGQVPGDRGELAAFYLAAFAALCVTGPGRYSLDGWLAERRRIPRESSRRTGRS